MGKIRCVEKVLIHPMYDKKNKELVNTSLYVMSSFGLKINEEYYGEIVGNDYINRSFDRATNWGSIKSIDSPEAILEIDKRLYSSSFLFGFSMFNEPRLRAILKELTDRLKKENIYFYYWQDMINDFNRTKKGREFIKYLYELQEI